MNNELQTRARKYAYAHNSNPNPPYCPEGELNRRLTDAYVAGAEDALTNQWRSVECELPKDGDLVLVYCELGRCLGNYDYQDREWYINGFGVAETVTQWMPIPKINKL